MTGRRSEAAAGRLSQRGVATVWSLAWLGVCLTVGWVALALAVAEARQHHADASADLVSLSAATTLQHGGDACRTAAEVAARNRVRLSSCRIRGADVVVSVTDQVALPFAVHVEVTGRARAGPS